jgi:DNA invertase Pin-like site-specific DNA recombinase
MAGRLAVFAEFERDIVRERERAGIAPARREGKPHGRPPSAFRQAAQIRQLFTEDLSKRAISRQLSIGRTSVRRILQATRGG